MRILISTLALLVLVAPTLIFAQNTPTSLINLPVSPQPGENGFSAYINLLYALSISAAALLAVIKIIIAGVKYMLTDVVTSKGDAIREIKGALLGLLLIIGAVLILTVINPKLLDATLEFDPQPMPDVAVAQPTVVSVGPGGASPSNPNARPVEEFAISSYGDIQQNLIQKTGVLVNYTPGTYCTTQSNAGATQTARNNLYTTCMNNQKDALTDYCTHNGGNFGTTPTSYTCQLPIESRGPDSFRTEYMANRAPTDTRDFDADVFREMCRASGGALKDLEQTSVFGVDDYRCVKF